MPEDKHRTQRDIAHHPASPLAPRLTARTPQIHRPTRRYRQPGAPAGARTRDPARHRSHRAGQNHLRRRAWQNRQDHPAPLAHRNLHPEWRRADPRRCRPEQRHLLRLFRRCRPPGHRQPRRCRRLAAGADRALHRRAAIRPHRSRRRRYHPALPCRRDARLGGPYRGRRHGAGHVPPHRPPARGSHSRPHPGRPRLYPNSAGPGVQRIRHRAGLHPRASLQPPHRLGILRQAGAILREALDARLHAAEAVESRQCGFTAARDGTIDPPLGIFDAARVRVWLDAMDRRFAGVRSWIP